MKGFIVAAQLYTVRDLLKDKSGDEVRGVLTKIKDIGYEAVQISGVGDVDKQIAGTYREVCSSLGLEICATHLSLDFLKNNFDWVVEYHKIWDCGIVGIGAMPPDMRSMEGALEFAHQCNKLGGALKDNGLSLVYHNHRFEFEKFGGKTMMSMLYEAFDPECVEFEIDTHWVQSGGGNPVDWIYKVDGRMSIVHFKDFRIVDNEQQFAEIGEGNLDWDAIIKACEKTGVKYAAVEQDAFTDDPVRSLKISFDFIKKLI